MTDLLHVLPDFPIARYTHLIPSLEKAYVTTADLLTLDAIDVARRAHLPPLDVRRLSQDVLSTLQSQLGLQNPENPSDGTYDGSKVLSSTGKHLLKQWSNISILDPLLDSHLGGGIPPGYITEITGESGAGKTQLLLTLLLSAQLPPPHGLSAKTIYISTEHPLPTTRLQQLLAHHKLLSSTSDDTDATSASALRVSLSNILTLSVPDLETQEHILTYQLPVALRTLKPGLVVLDSIAANYRASASNAQALATRSAHLQRTGALLRALAREHHCAIVVVNQVADRFTSDLPRPHAAHLSPHPRSPAGRSGGAAAGPSSLLSSQPSTLLSSSPSPAAESRFDFPAAAHVAGYDGLADPLDLQRRGIAIHPSLSLDHQQRFFTGWGDNPAADESDVEPHSKTPALGLVWANQIACRIALTKEAAWGANADESDKLSQQSAEWTPRRWRRWMRLAFAPWARPTEPGDRGAEFEIWAGGVRAVGDA